MTDKIKFSETILKSIERFHTINDTAIMVNLDAPPSLPFRGAKIAIEFHNSSGWVKIEKRAKGLYMNGHKIILYCSCKQGAVDRGYSLIKDLICQEFSARPVRVIHPNVIDALYRNQHLIPENWKKRLSIYFWGVIFRDAEGGLFVRYFFFGDNKMHCESGWLGTYLTEGSPAAVF